MATKLQVKCINKSDRTNEHERILAIGGNVCGQHWKHTESSAIQWIKSGVYSYYVVSERGGEVDVIVARSRHGHEYLKTTTNGEKADNLISLPECS